MRHDTGLKNSIRVVAGLRCHDFQNVCMSTYILVDGIIIFMMTQKHKMPWMELQIQKCVYHQYGKSSLKDIVHTSC